MRTVNVVSSRSRVDAVPVSGIRTYTLLWCSQWIALTASLSTTLVLGYDIYHDFHSLVMIAVAYTILFVPFVVLSPIAGALVDRWGQHRALLISNAGTLATLLVLVVLMLTDTIGLWPAITLLSIAAIFKSLQLAALESAAPLLLPKRHIGRANGSRMLLTVAAVIMGPPIVGLLLLVVKPVVLIGLECAAVALAIVVLGIVRIPSAPDDASPGSLPTEILSAYTYLRSRRGLVAVVGFLAAISFVLAFLEIAASQAVYAFASDGGLAVVFGAGFVGMLLTSLAMTIWGRPRRLARGMLGAGLAFAAALVLGALRPSVALMATSAFVALGSAAIVMSTIQTVLHTKVEPQLLGRVMGLKNAMIGAPHIAGNVGVTAFGATLQPLVGRNHVDSPLVSAIVGNGPGRSYAVLMLAVGVLAALYVLLAFRSQGLRRVQDDLPDVTPADRPAPVASTPTASASVLAAAHPAVR